MIISDKYKFIFIHVPRTAGSSIEADLHRYLKDEIIRISEMKKDKNRMFAHTTALEIRKIISLERFYGYFKFAFVRNPWDRMVSLYHHWTQNGSGKFRERILSYKDFNHWLKEWIPKTMTQLDYITNRNDKVIVNFIGRFENLNKDFEKICDEVGVPRIKLSHFAKSEHKPFFEYYNKETKQLVAETFEKEIEMFGYKFGGFKQSSIVNEKVLGRSQGDG